MASCPRASAFGLSPGLDSSGPLGRGFIRGSSSTLSASSALLRERKLRRNLSWKFLRRFPTAARRRASWARRSAWHLYGWNLLGGVLGEPCWTTFLTPREASRLRGGGVQCSRRVDRCCNGSSGFRCQRELEVGRPCQGGLLTRKPLAHIIIHS
jgi:hypothetical protein